MTEITSYTAPITPAQADVLKTILEAQGYVFREVPYARYGAQKGKLNITAYTSGKCLVQGRGTREFVEFVLEPQVLGVASLGYEFELNPEQLDTRIGVDESGKGDFFGPLVIAAVYVNEEAVRFLQERGVRDSKKITSDKKIADLARAILDTPGVRAEVIPIMPETYNRLHVKMRSVNNILGWGHARVIENMLERMPLCKKAISDQFARTEYTVRKYLGERGRQIELIQRHKAESDFAVAAASILAREGFVSRLQSLSREAGLTLPKGASPAVKAAARDLVARFGEDRLDHFCKRHFKTRNELDE
ncbi:MAG: ribonuclease HIII [Verrucomicrobiae bacterium]|nr:ribonuclease HIII [Verrucomicrobiae bacterium]